MSAGWYAELGLEELEAGCDVGSSRGGSSCRGRHSTLGVGMLIGWCMCGGGGVEGQHRSHVSCCAACWLPRRQLPAVNGFRREPPVSP